jgi:dinuclear metal center YbgI/SA1388 family protein
MLNMKETRTISRSKLVKYLDDYLNIAGVPDRSLNGLQVEGSVRIRRAAFAVDASLATIRAAARLRAEILVVHHGLFWSQNERITGVMRRRIGALLENNISLYGAHLPLDCHEEVGNNVELARLLRLDLGEKFADYHGVRIGFTARPKTPLARSALARTIENALGCRVKRLDFGPAKIRQVGIVSGKAAEYAAEAKDLGCDAFITGETSHTAYHPAKEARINVFFAGHYASETVGVKALARHLGQRFSLDCRFISAPTGY